MNAVGQLATSWWGPQSAAIVVILLTVVIWAIKTIPGWLVNRSGRLPGSPATARYWRARLTEALAQLKDVPEGPERSQFAARVTEARIMVEAHEASRRMGRGSQAFYWILFGVFAGGAVLFNVIGTQAHAGSANLVALGFVVAMLVAEVLALNTGLAVDERFNALVAAGRFGHNDQVRANPWWLTRTYDEWKSRLDLRKTKRARVAHDKMHLRRRIRWRRALYGLTAWPRAIEINSDIWADGEPENLADPSI